MTSPGSFFGFFTRIECVKVLLSLMVLKVTFFADFLFKIMILFIILPIPLNIDILLVSIYSHRHRLIITTLYRVHVPR